MFTPDPHQLTGADWLAARSHGYLADDMGLGKTATALLAFRKTRLNKLLVLCPTSVAPTWLKETQAVLPGARCGIIEPDTALSALDVVIAPYSIAAREAVRLIGWGADVVAGDEMHFLKTSTAQRTVAARQISRHAHHVWGLSGTPMPNDPTELWSQLVICAPAALGSPALTETAWAHTYCAGYPTKFGFKPTALKNLERFRAEVLPHFLRRTLADVQITLPDRITRLLPVHAPEAPPPGSRAARQQAALPAVPTLSNVAAAMAGVGFTGAAAESAARIWGTRKATLVAPHIAHLLANNSVDKVVVGAKHHDALDVLQAQLAPFGLVRVDGRCSIQQRSRAVEAFQTRPDCRVFLGQIDACAEGITLTAAATCFQVELADRASTNLQFAKRLHRRGQTRKVLHYLVTMDEGPDAAAMKNWQIKLAMMQAAQLSD